jgi:hypothetical protein
MEQGRSDDEGTTDPLGAIEVVNVDTWGSGEFSMSGGTVLPQDAPPGDMDWAREHKVIVSGAEYKAAHPDWMPAPASGSSAG